MQLNLIELDIQNRKEALKRCKANLLACKVKREVELLRCEVFYLKDQLDMLCCVASILKEEQGVYDEMLPKV